MIKDGDRLLQELKDKAVNYSDNDAKLLIQEFTKKHPYPYAGLKGQIHWERKLVVYALERGHADKQREEE